jgi:hypothetical protein
MSTGLKPQAKTGDEIIIDKNIVTAIIKDITLVFIYFSSLRIWGGVTLPILPSIQI